MTALQVIERIVNDPRGNGIEMDVCNDLQEVVLGVDESCAIPALPEASQIAPAF